MNADYGADDMPITFKAKLLLKYDLFIYRVGKLPEKFLMWLARRLPKKLVYWAAIRLMAHATTGKYGSQVVPELTMGDALNRWEY